METPSSETTLARLQRAHDVFQKVWKRGTPSCQESRLLLCGEPARIRIAGEVLSRHFLAPLAHLALPEASTVARLKIDLWDEREVGVSGLPAAEQHAEGKTWTLGDGRFAASPDGRIVSHELRRSIVWLDRRDEQIVGWFADGGDLSLHQQGKPLQMLLALWASDRGLQAVHAGMVARDGDGVLVPARSGSGKSTVALACLEAGFTYLGDDWIGVGRGADGFFAGHGLYSSTSLEEHHAARFPRLQPHLIPPTDANERKSLVLLPPLFPRGLGSSARVRALALPRVVDRPGTSWHRASKRDAILMLAPSALFAMRPRTGREGLERLAELAAGVPAYWLEIGRDLGTIPGQVEEILASAKFLSRRERPGEGMK